MKNVLKLLLSAVILFAAAPAFATADNMYSDAAETVVDV